MSSHSSLETRNKALMQRWFEEVWNHGCAELIDEMRAPDATATGLSEGTAESNGAAPFKVFYSNLRQVFPDLHVTIEEMLAEGEKVAVRIVMEGTHSSPVLGPPATGRKVTVGAMVIARIADGKIAQAWNIVDQLALLRQIGALPPGTVRENFLTTRP
jgi:steroid delta-isomerase-like uncharacterized protein